MTLILSKGEFTFSWKVVAATGVVEGEYEQTYAAEDFPAAAQAFVNQHGPLSPNEDGVCIVITNIAWMPEKE